MGGSGGLSAQAQGQKIKYRGTERLRQVQHDATYRDDDLGSEFFRKCSRKLRLRPGVTGWGTSQAHLLHRTYAAAVSSTGTCSPKSSSTGSSDLHASCSSLILFSDVAPLTVKPARKSTADLF